MRVVLVGSYKSPVACDVCSQVRFPRWETSRTTTASWQRFRRLRRRSLHAEPWPVAPTQLQLPHMLRMCLTACCPWLRRSRSCGAARPQTRARRHCRPSPPSKSTQACSRHLFPFVPFRFVSYLVLSCLVLSCLVVSRLVLSWLVLSCLVLSCLVLSSAGIMVGLNCHLTGNYTGLPSHRTD